MEKESRYVEIKIKGFEPSDVTLGDVGLFLYDVATLYELLRLAVDAKYDDFQFSRFSLFRTGRPVEPADKLIVRKLRHESPIEIVLTVNAETAVAVGVVWILIQSFDKIYNFWKTRKKLNLDIENAQLDKRERELRIKKLENESKGEKKPGENVLFGESAVVSERIIRLRNADTFVEIVERRLEKSPVQIKTIEADVIDPHKEEQNRYAVWDWLENYHKAENGGE